MAAVRSWRVGEAATTICEEGKACSFRLLAR